jgi:hypothetical protein
VKPSRFTAKRRLVYAVGSVANLLLKIDHITANSKSMIKSVEGKIVSSQNLAIFATYSERPLDEFDLQVLSDLRSSGFGICIVVNVKNEVHTNYSNYADVVIKRKNIGLDIAAIRDALRILGSDWNRIVLLNDSVIWPKNNFPNVIAAVLDFDGINEVLGLVDSYQRSHHIQSFFLSANHYTAKELFEAYMSIRNWRFKRSIVTFGEIPIKSNLQRIGVNFQPLISYKELESNLILSGASNSDEVEIIDFIKRGIPLNPSQHLWRMLLHNEFGCVKRSLIQSNPAKLAYPPTYSYVSKDN